MPKCFQIDVADNVATLLQDGEAGAMLANCQGELLKIPLAQPIKLGHKVALSSIAAGAPVVKYGITIGTATRPILAGEWVHLHNCQSCYDERSSELNIETSSRKENPYA
jgi:altronate dehydratase small subunit